MRILVCGGRTFGDLRPPWPHNDEIDLEYQRKRYQFIQEELDRICKDFTDIVIIEGDARGADRAAGDWARKNKTGHEKYPITQRDWGKYKKAAGPMRNLKMLTEGKPDLVIAFPGDTGTAHMVRISKEAGIPVKEIDYKKE